mgnify:CR=1 FL=1
MGWRFKKRFFYLSLLFLIILIFLSPKIYRFILNPSCYNGRQDFNEEGIDCGGPCIPCKVKELKDLIAERPIILIYPDNTMDLVGIIKNPNEKYGLKEFEYEFILRGPYKEEYKVNGKSFILPLENKYIIEQNKNVPNFQIVDSELKIYFDKNNWQEIDFKSSKVSLLNYNIDQGIFEGEVINENYIDYPRVTLNFIAKDREGNIIGVFKTVIYNLKSGEKRTIRITNLPQFLDKPEEIILSPEINFFEL